MTATLPYFHTKYTHLKQSMYVCIYIEKITITTKSYLTCCGNTNQIQNLHYTTSKQRTVE